MYPGTTVVWEDQSYSTEVASTTVRTQPLYAVTFTSDKGTEDWTRIEGEDFFNMYGNNISFAKHGQPLLQAAMSANWGATLLAKRVVAPDSTLANLSIIAKVETEQVQAVDADGNLLYEDEGGEQTTEETDTPVMVSAAKISYTAKTVADCVSEVDENGVLNKAKDAVYSAIQEEVLEDNQFLLFTIVDNGRGVSNKRFYIVPDYTVSKAYSFTMYRLVIMENGSTVETIRFALDPDMIINDQNISLAAMIRTNSSQVEAKQYDDQITAFIAKVQEYSGLTDDEISTSDILFGCTQRGVAYNTINVDIETEGNVNLQHPYGQSLQSGTNGSFGDAPLEADEYATEMAKAYTDDPTTVIYDVDRYQIDAIVDANYPAAVKRAIEALADFREDFVYFRDMGTGLRTYDDIVLANKNNSQSKFCATYENSYDIIDPYSRKQITVTIGYSLARLIIEQFNNGRNLPLAGQKYSMVIDEAVPETINFIPVIAPGYNQKEDMDDLKVNYVSYIGDQLVMQTLYTSYDKNSAYSYVNNILAIQEVIKAVRTRCPAIRYTFMSGDDLEKYKADVTEVIERYKSNFESISMEYIEDDDYIANKTFYAAIRVQCKDFIQAEYFRVIAVNSTTVAY